MAKKKEETQEVSTQTTGKGQLSKETQVTQTEVNNERKKEIVSQEVKKDLSKEETAALEIQEKALQGQAPTKKYKLSKKHTQYTDPESGWSIYGDEEKELPPNPSLDTLARIKSGFIVEA